MAEVPRSSRRPLGPPRGAPRGRDAPDVVAAAHDADVTLLPGIGDLEPECDCPTWDLPCLHAAALSYQAGWLLDADPFVLFLLRGRSRDQVIDALRGISAPGHGRDSGRRRSPRRSSRRRPGERCRDGRSGVGPRGPRRAAAATRGARATARRGPAARRAGPDRRGTPVDLVGLRAVLAAAALAAAERLTALDR
ncbi:SWIM zinc finger family protein [Oerskovia sp. M15]